MSIVVTHGGDSRGRSQELEEIALSEAEALTESNGTKTETAADAGIAEGAGCKSEALGRFFGSQEPVPTRCTVVHEI